MKNILRSLLGDKAYKQLLKLIGNGGGGSNDTNAIKVNFSEEFPFVETNTRALYTSLVRGETATEDDIQHYQALINDNIKLANPIIQNFNSDKATFLSIEAYNSKDIGSAVLSAEPGFIGVLMGNDMFYKVPVTFSLDGKATLKDNPYTVRGK